MTTTAQLPALSDADRALLLAAGSATAYEASGLPCALGPAFRPAWPGARCVGTALPVAAAPADNLPLHWAVAAARPGDVLTVDADGSEHGYWGDVLATAALERGAAGLVIDGGVRDTGRLAALGFPAFSTSVSILGTAKRWPGRVGSPVTLRGTPVERGDIVVADADGVAVLPHAQLPRIVAATRARMQREAALAGEIARGALTLDLYRFRDLGHPADWPAPEEQPAQEHDQHRRHDQRRRNDDERR